MTSKKEIACDNLLRICRRIQKRFQDGHMPTFEQMNQFDAAIFGFDVMLMCGHLVIDECDHSDKDWNTWVGTKDQKKTWPEDEA